MHCEEHGEEHGEEHETSIDDLEVASRVFFSGGLCTLGRNDIRSPRIAH